MAKGAISKDIVTNKILSMFESSFVYEKKIYIPMTENGETLQIAVSLTCPKNLVETTGTPIMSKTLDFEHPENNVVAVPVIANSEPLEVSQDERDNIEEMMKRLGL